MRRIVRSALCLPLLAAACSTPNQYQSYWMLCHRPPAEARETAVRTLRELGYDAAPGRSGEPLVEGRFSEAGRTIQQQIEFRPSGNECEIRVYTTGECKDAESQRVRNAHERLLGSLDAAMRAPASPNR